MFVSRLKYLRKAKKMNQEEFADAVGINRSTYAGYESGQREPDFNTLILIAKYHDVTTDYLLGLSIYPRYILSALTEDEAEYIESSLDLYQRMKRKYAKKSLG